MNPSLIISFESSDPSDIALASLYWRFDDEGHWLYTVSQIADHMSISSSEVSKRVAVVGPIFVTCRRCEECLLPFKFRNRSEYGAADRDSQKVCEICRETAAQKLRDEEELIARASRQLQQALWLRNTSIDPEVNVEDMEYSDVIRAFAIFTSSESDDEGNLRFADVPAFSAKHGALQEAIKSLYEQEVLLIGKGTPLNAFVPGESVDNFSYYPARIVWRFATLGESHDSSMGTELACRVDNPQSNYEYWNSVAEIWWEEGYAEALRYLNEQLEKYGLEANEGEALKLAINHALDNFSIPRFRNLLWKLAKDIGAFSAERGISRPHAVNAVPGKLTRMVDRYLANEWDVTPYVLRWDDEESLLITTLFDRVLKTGVAGFKFLSGREIQENRLRALKEQRAPDQTSASLNE
jgi:hypothetical protein